jgi:hypothetical protein
VNKEALAYEGLLRKKKKACILEVGEQGNTFAEGMVLILEPSETGTVKPSTARQITV